MRLAAIVVLVGCSEHGASPTDATDAPDDVTMIDTPADTLAGTNPGFERPTAPLAANTEVSEDNWMEIGPADLSCLGTASTDQSTTVAVQLSTSVRDFQSDLLVPSTTIKAFQNLAAPFDTDVTDAGGNATLTIPSGTSRFGFDLTEADSLRTIVLRSIVAPSQANQTLPAQRLFSKATGATLPALIGVSRTAGTGLVLARFLDCQGREVSHFIATVSSTAGVPAHVPGADTYYFSSSVGLPVRHTQKQASSEDGQFMVIELQPTATAFLQVWGFLDAGALAADQLTLIGELAIPSLADTVVGGTLEPIRQ